MQTRADFFSPRKYDVISQLCHSYAKDPFCVMQLIFVLIVCVYPSVLYLALSLHCYFFCVITPMTITVAMNFIHIFLLMVDKVYSLVLCTKR